MVKKRLSTILAWVAGLILFVSLQAGAEVVDRIVALVNDEMISLSQLNEATKPYREKILASQQTDEQKQQLLSQLNQDMLSQMIDASLAKQEAVKYGIQVGESEVDTAIENFQKANGLDAATLEKGLAAEGLTMAAYRERMKDQILQSMLINRAVRSKIIVTDEDVKAYYESHQESFTGLKKYKLRNILTQTESQMQEVISRLGNKEDFSVLAKEISIGSNASEGGDLGVFDIDSFSREIRDALKDLNKGEHTAVLQTGSAYQIIYVEDVVTEGNQTLGEATEKIRDILFRSQGEQQFKEWIEKLKNNAHIKQML